MSPATPLNIAILASGSGTNAQAMIDKMRQGLLSVRIAAIICNRPGAKVLERARAAGIADICIDHTQFPDRESHDRAMVAAIRQSGAQLVVLAGYMRLLSGYFLAEVGCPVINLHPAILPSFPGVHGGADALDWGVKISGATVHFVEEAMDSGPPIIQAAVPVNADDDEESLMQRIHAMEHRIYPQAVQWFAEGRIDRQGRRVAVSATEKPRAAVIGDYFVWPPLEEGF